MKAKRFLPLPIGSLLLIISAFCLLPKLVFAADPTLSLLAGNIGHGGYWNATGSVAQFLNPYTMVRDSSDNIYVADQYNNAIRKITPAGVVTTFAGGTAGSTDGTGTSARFANPLGIGIDSSNNLYVADTANSTIRKITPAGVVTTIAGSVGSIGSTDGTGTAARFKYPAGLTVDSSGNIFVVDQGNNTIRKVTSSGVVSTLAGTAGTSGSTDGTGSAARFSTTWDIGVNNSGDLYVTDYSNHTLRKITSAGVVTTLAGAANISGSADGSGSSARLQYPLGLDLDSSGNIYVADQYNHTIRKITPTGVTTTVVGVAGSNGVQLGVGGRLSFPNDVVVLSTGQLAISSDQAILQTQEL